MSPTEMVMAEMKERIKDLEQKLAVAVEALESIAIEYGRPTEMMITARKALAQINGEKEGGE